MTPPDPAREGDSGLSLREIAEITSEAARLFVQMMERSLLWGGRTMPSKSKAQNRLMHAVAEDPAVAKKTGVSQKVAKEFVAADTGRKIGKLPNKVKGKK
jgi:hypothetical protein